mmetsp:Transcript_74584/g.150854  ORF Transcript_74584/g.150854 Transcript_74584/m.150854 type:complete len:307 (-) Transcript_74584:592-1512(-)
MWHVFGLAAREGRTAREGVRFSSLLALLHHRLAMIALRTLRHNIEIGPGEKGLVHHVAMLHALAWGEAGLRLAAAHVKGLAMHATGLHLRATLATFAAGRDVEAGELQGFHRDIVIVGLLCWRLHTHNWRAAGQSVAPSFLLADFRLGFPVVAQVAFGFHVEFQNFQGIFQQFVACLVCPRHGGTFQRSTAFHSIDLFVLLADGSLGFASFPGFPGRFALAFQRDVEAWHFQTRLCDLVGMEALRAGCCAFLGRAAAEAVVVAALGAHAGLRPAHVTFLTAGSDLELLGVQRIFDHHVARVLGLGG